MNRPAKRVVEQVLLPLAARSRRRQAVRGEAAILSYHNVAPARAAPSGDVSLHVPLDSFLEQIDRLSRTHRVVPLTDLVSGRGRGGTRPAAAITFDDAYLGAMTLGVPALVERGIPSTIFVTPGLLGASAFWWDQLSAPGGRGLDPGVRARALDVEKGRPDTTRSTGDHLRRDQAPSDLETLRRVAALPAVSLAAHSWSHPNLVALDPQDLQMELERPRTWLAEMFPGSLGDHLAFPYGLWDGRVAHAAQAAGYRFLYRVEGGVAPAGQGARDPWPRINVPAGVSGPGFDLRVAGVVGGKRS